MGKDITKIKIGVLAIERNKLLLIKELNSSDGKYYWNIIKGIFEPTKDKDFFEAAKRESREEAGIEIKLVNLINIVYLRKRDRKIIQFNFKALIKKSTPKLSIKNQYKVKNEDIMKVKFFTKKELKKMKKQEFINIRTFLTIRDWIENKNKNLGTQDASQNLQEKVDQQTKELKQAYDKIEHAYEIEKKAHKDLKDLSEAKNQFILATQHHLRTPLTIMKGYASMLIEGDYGKLNKKAKEKLVFFSESTQKLINLVNEFLDISQFQVGKKVLKIEKVNVEKLIKEIIEEFEMEAKNKDIYLRLKKSNRISTIKADYAKLKEAIYNIIDNGIKYTEKGGITISLEMENKKLKIIIKDTGIGIGKKEINSLFEKTFERSKEAQKLYTLGRGIGLYISSNIIKAHNGKIQAESSGENSGSTFYVELPVR